MAGVTSDTIDPNAKLSYTSEFQVGFEREILPKTSLGVRYTYRNIGRILEDVANAPLAAYDLGVPGTVDRWSTSSPIRAAARRFCRAPPFLGASFDDPVHKYHAVEVTLNRRFADNWSLLASYRWSRLRGNFEGFYRDDNGQSDPGISSLYDFPTNDPSYTAIGVPAVRLLAATSASSGQSGILPLDRPQQFKAYGNYVFPKGLNVGIGLNIVSGAPLTPLAANPELRQRRRNSGGAARLGHSDRGRFHDADTGPDHGRSAGLLQAESGRTSRDHAAGRCVQPVQLAASDHVRPVVRVLVSGPEP